MLDIILQVVVAIILVLALASGFIYWHMPGSKLDLEEPSDD